MKKQFIRATFSQDLFRQNDFLHRSIADEDWCKAIMSIKEKNWLITSQSSLLLKVTVTISIKDEQLCCDFQKSSAAYL